MKFLVGWAPIDSTLGGPCWPWLPVLDCDIAPFRSKDRPFTTPVDWALDAEGIGWLTATLRAAFGVLDPEPGVLPSPSLTKDSIVRSRLPLNPFSTCAFRLSSWNPISLSCVSFASSSSPPPPTLAPNTLDCLFTLIGEGGPLKPCMVEGECGGEVGPFRCRGNADDALLSPKPNLLPGFGGRGGGWSSELRVLPVSVRAAGLRSPPEKSCWSYFCLMNFSKTASTSSTSSGIGGFVF